MNDVKRFFDDDYNMSFVWLALSVIGGALLTYW